MGNNDDDDESDKLDHLASSLQASGFGRSPDAENTNTGHFGATTTMDRSNESQAIATDGCKSCALHSGPSFNSI